MGVVLFSKPGCQPCKATKRKLDAKGVDYKEFDISVDMEARDKVISLGFKQAPVVVTESDAWSGFNPGKIDALIAEISLTK